MTHDIQWAWGMGIRVRSPTAATDTAVTLDLSKCTSADEWIVGGNFQYGGLTCVIV
jgi:hypothetical protein